MAPCRCNHDPSRLLVGLGARKFPRITILTLPTPIAMPAPVACMVLDATPGPSAQREESLASEGAATSEVPELFRVSGTVRGREDRPLEEARVVVWWQQICDEGFRRIRSAVRPSISLPNHLEGGSCRLV